MGRNWDEVEEGMWMSRMDGIKTSFSLLVEQVGEDSFRGSACSRDSDEYVAVCEAASFRKACRETAAWASAHLR